MRLCSGSELIDKWRKYPIQIRKILCAKVVLFHTDINVPVIMGLSKILAADSNQRFIQRMVGVLTFLRSVIKMSES